MKEARKAWEHLLRATLQLEHLPALFTDRERLARSVRIARRALADACRAMPTLEEPLEPVEDLLSRHFSDIPTTPLAFKEMQIYARWCYEAIRWLKEGIASVVRHERKRR